MQYLIGIVALLVGALFFQRSKLKSAEALNESNQANKEAQKLDGQIEKNKGLIEAEQQKREDIKKETTDEEANSTGNSDFFNKRK